MNSMYLQNKKNQNKYFWRLRCTHGCQSVFFNYIYFSVFYLCIFFKKKLSDMDFYLFLVFLLLFTFNKLLFYVFFVFQNISH